MIRRRAAGASLRAEASPPLAEDAHPRSPSPLRTEALCVRYRRQVAVRNVDLEVPAGEVTAIVGPSGCGKSSFLYALNRLTDLIPHCRVSGRVRWQGGDALSPDTDVVQLRRRVGMIFQRPNPFPFSIRRNLELPLREHGVRDRRERGRRAEHALRQVGLFEEVRRRLDSSALALSGGQQQRLCLARALVLDPEVLLLDEPCSALDPIASRVVEDLVLALRGRYTVVVVTHNLAQARRVADRVALFWLRDGAGELVEEGSCEDFFATPRTELARRYVQGLHG